MFALPIVLSDLQNSDGVTPSLLQMLNWFVVYPGDALLSLFYLSLYQILGGKVAEHVQRDGDDTVIVHARRDFGAQVYRRSAVSRNLH